MTESGGLQKSSWKHRVSLRGSPLTVTEVQHSAYQLLSSTLTFNDVLIGIDLVRGKMWPSETITFWLSSKSIENRTESGGTCQRNQAFRLTRACGFFEMPWPSQMSIRTHRFIQSIEIFWCLIGTDFVRGKMCLSNLQLIHSHLFSSTSCLAFPPAQYVEQKHVLSYLHPICEMQFRHHGRMPGNYTTDWNNFCIDMVFLFPFVNRFSILSSDDFPFPSLVAFEFGASEGVRSFCLRSSLPLPEALTPWWKPHESPLEHCPLACHCQQSPTFLSTLALFSFRLRVTTILHESYHFGLWGSDFSSSVMGLCHWCF